MMIQEIYFLSSIDFEDDLVVIDEVMQIKANFSYL